MSETLALPVVETSQVGDARRKAAAIAARLGLDETAAGRIALVVTEAGNNLARHARGGELLLRPLEAGGPPEAGGRLGLEVLSLDRGPGMANVAECLADGFSSAGTAGKGLGAIRRAADTFDLHSIPSSGTALLAQVWSVRSGEPAPQPNLGVVSVPHPGEEVCGDGWAVNESSGRRLILVVDGLGHGAAAAAAAREAQRVFREYCTSDPGEILDRTHGALRSTRGAAVAVAEIREDARELRYAGVGNIAAAAIAPNGVSQHLVSHNGTVGHVVRKIQEFTYPFAPGSLLVMHSDGLGTRWRLDPYPGIAARHPGLVAGVLYRDHKRGRDDVTVLATRAAGGLSS